ncbi:MAG: hypothetical protein WCP85_14970 [Mariniphaga sp.]
MNWLKKIFGNFGNSRDDNSLIFDFVHRNTKYGFSIGYNKDWDIRNEDQYEGEWIHPIILAKENTALCILSIGKLGESGSIEQYIKQAKSQLSGGLRNFTIIDEKETSINNWPTAWMHYSYYENGKTMEEFNITFFFGKNNDLAFLSKNVDVLFQIVCFTDKSSFKNLKTEFLDMIHSLSFPNYYFWLPYVKVYGYSSHICKSCKKIVIASNSILAVKFPENELVVICKNCKESSSFNS